MLKMKKILFLCLFILLICSSICMASSETAAPINESSEEGSSHFSVLNTDLYIADNNVVVDNIVNGNAFVYGSNVTIKNDIMGDLFVLGNSVSIDEQASVVGNVFVYATDLTINGEVIDLYGFSQTFTLGDSGKIDRDLRLYSNSCTINGLIGKDAYIAANTISLKNSTSNLIAGNLHYTSSEEINIEDGVVKGEVKYTPVSTEEVSVQKVITNYMIILINVLVYSIATILVIIFLGPKFTEKLSYCLSKRAFASTGIGIIGVVFVPVLALMLFVTRFATYLGIAMFVLYLLMLSITISILGIAVGNYLANKLKNKTKAKTFGLSIASVAVIWLLQLIPTIGSWISIFTVVFGFGLLLFANFIRKDVTDINTQQTSK